jgi:hypothetical protein
MPTSLPDMLRPRQEFPTPLFRIALPLLAAGLVALVAYLAFG